MKQLLLNCLLYIQTFLKIIDKKGKTIPFVLNEPQRKLYGVIKIGVNHQLVAPLRVRGAPARVHIIIHGMRCRVPTLIFCCRCRGACKCRVISAEIFELPIKIKAFSFSGRCQSRGECQ